MSHELTIRANGAVEMAYLAAEGTPWHGLGQALPQGQTIDQWQSAAGMDWRIQRSQVRYATSRDDATAPPVFPDQHVLLRSDTKQPLGIVSARYKTVQPIEALTFFEDLCARNGFHLSTAGTLFGGRRFWALAHIGEQAQIVPNDAIGGYLLFVTSADGSLATTAKFTAVRAVCNNTVSLALAQGAQSGRAVKVSHRSQFNPDDVKRQLGLAHEQFPQFAQSLSRLADKNVSQARAERILFDLLAPASVAQAPNLTDIQKVTDSSAFKRILALFNGQGMGATLDGVKGTAWGLFNATTEYVDHHVRATSADNRLSSAWFGPGDALKTRALDLVTAL